MFEIVGKTTYTVTVNGTSYTNLKFCLRYLKYPSSFHSDASGYFCETVKLKPTEHNSSFQIGDIVDLGYDAFRNPSMLIEV